MREGRYEGGATSALSEPTAKVLGRSPRMVSRSHHSRSSKVLRRMPSAA
jgi:hypothetical protein